MKRPDHATARRLIFSIYILLTALFCFALYQAGRAEIGRAEAYSAREGRYVENLHSCLEKLNDASRAASEFGVAKKACDAAKCAAAAEKFKTAAEKLRDAAIARSAGSEAAAREIVDMASGMQALALAGAFDAAAPEPEREQALLLNAKALANAGANAAAALQRLLRQEMDSAGLWRRESLHFFTNLEIMVIVFFVATTAFSVMASFVYGALLKSSIRKLADATRELRSGRLEHRLDNPPRDELGALMKDFNEMAATIEAQSKALALTNAELREQAAQLVAAHRHKDRFLANMSHELRTPLNAVMGFADIIEQRADALKQEKIKNDALRISAAAEHLLELITGLLEIARFDAGQLKPALGDFDLAFCLDEAASMLAPLAEKKGLELRVELPQGVVVGADRRMLRQIAINLLGNAIKFTSKGFVALRAKDEGAFFSMEVEDSGIGIADEDKPLIFADFHRVENGLTSQYPGAGIGLSLSKRLVELHGGKIIFTSSLAKGSLFKATIPNQKHNHEDGK